MSKNLRAFRCGANILGYNIDSINYVMTCAWAMMIDYDKIAMLIGAQSITGQNLKKDMKVGVSSLASGQESIAKIIGSTHSDEVDKLKDISYENKDGMILINDSKEILKTKKGFFTLREDDCYLYKIQDVTLTRTGTMILFLLLL